jgi:hypothetical protein
MLGLTRQTAEFVASLTPDAIPASCTEGARVGITDCVAVMIAGASEEAPRLASSPRQAGQEGIFAAALGSASFRRRLPGLPRSRTTLLGRGLRPRIGVSPSQSRPEDRQLLRHP